MKYTVSYDKNGVVTQVSTGGIVAGVASRYFGELEIDHYVSPHDGHVVNGCWVAFPPNVAESKANPPAYDCEWDHINLVWVDKRTPQVAETQAWSQVRNQRQQLLQASDWTTLSDVPLTIEQKAQWATYRQALRDVTNQPGPLNIVWPVPPSN